MNPTKKLVMNPTKKLVMNPTKKLVMNPTKKSVMNPTKKLVMNPTKKSVMNPTKKLAIKWTKTITPLQVNKLIRAEKDLSNAIDIFDAASEEYINGFRHDRATFTLIINRLVSGNRFKLAEDLLRRMKEENLSLSEGLFLTICRGYGRVHKPLEAVRVFEGMRDFGVSVSEKCYVTLMSILVDESQMKLAMKVYKEMRRLGFQPSVVSVNVLLKALCKNEGTLGRALSVFREMGSHGCVPDSCTYGTLVSGLGKFGRVEEAYEIFREMEEKGCVPSVVAYSSLIHGLFKVGKIDDALTLFREMPEKGVEPNVFTYSSVMDGLCKCGRSLVAMKLLDVMLERSHKPNLITYTTLILGLCKDGNLHQAMELFDKVKLQGLKPDAGLCGNVISCYCNLNKFHDAANILDEMVLGGISPNRLTWNVYVKAHNTVIQGLCKTDLNRAFQLYLSMRTRGLTVDHGVFSSFIKGFCMKNNFDKACLILDHMFCDGSPPDMEMWRSILGRFFDEGKMLESFELLEDLLVRKLDEPVKFDSFDKACQILDRMVRDGSLPDMETWRSTLERIFDEGRMLESAELLQGLVVEKLDEPEKSSVG